MWCCPGVTPAGTTIVTFPARRSKPEANGLATINYYGLSALHLVFFFVGEKGGGLTVVIQDDLCKVGDMCGRVGSIPVFLSLVRIIDWEPRTCVDDTHQVTSSCFPTVHTVCALGVIIRGLKTSRVDLATKPAADACAMTRLAMTDATETLKNMVNIFA